MEKRMKKAVLAVLTALLLGASVCLTLGSLPARAASGEKMIRISLNTGDAQLKKHVQAMGDDKYFISVLSPFKKDVFKDNAFGNWWNGVDPANGTGKFKIEMDIFSSDRVALGIAPQVENSYGFLSESALGYADSNKIPLISKELEGKMENGWYRRSVVFDTSVEIREGTTVGSQLLGNIFFVLMINKTEIALDSAIDIYIHNFYVTVNGTRLRMFGDDDSLVKADGLLSEPYIYDGSNWDILNKAGYSKEYFYFEEVKKIDGEVQGKGISVAAQEAFDPVSIRQVKQNIIETQNTEIDLLSYVESTDPQAAPQVAAVLDPSGRDVTAEVKEGGKFLPASAGEYTVTYHATDSRYTAAYTLKFTSTDERKPVIMQEDVDAALTGTPVAGQKYELPAVMAYLRGEKTVVCVPSVTGVDGEEIPVSAEAEGKYSFVPTAKKEGVYHVTYSAENEGFTADSKSGTITVVDLDKPVISFDSLPGSFEVGSTFSVPEIAVTDVSDGRITDYALTIKDPHGNVIRPENGKFLVELSGKYQFEVSATDSDGNTITKAAAVATSQSAGLVYKVTLYVPEENRAAGKRKYFAGTFYELNPKITIDSGDKLVYEVMSNSDIAGVGSIGGQMEGNWQGLSWPRFSQLYKKDGKPEILDGNGCSMLPTADISDKLFEGEGGERKAVWYRREIEFKAGDTFAGGTVYHWAVEIDTEDACGETIEVSFKNAYLLKSDGTKVMIIDGTKGLDAAHWGTPSDDPDGEGVNLGISAGFVNASLDKFPVLISDLLPAIADLKKELELPLYLMIDQYTGTAIRTNLVIVDPEGETVSLQETATGYRFTPDKIGDYVIHVSGTNAAGLTRHTAVLNVNDNQPPTIRVGEYAKTVEKGTRVTLPEISFSDNATPADRLVTSVSVFIDGKRVELTDKTFLADQVGTYQIVISATDAAGLEQIYKLEIVCAAVVSPQTPFPVWAIVLICVGGLLIAGGVTAVILRRKRNAK